MAKPDKPDKPDKDCTREIRELCEALRVTAEYANLPPQEGWSWWEAFSKYAPADAEVYRSRWQPTVERITDDNGDELETGAPDLPLDQSLGSAPVLDLEARRSYWELQFDRGLHGHLAQDRRAWVEGKLRQEGY